MGMEVKPCRKEASFCVTWQAIRGCESGVPWSGQVVMLVYGVGTDIELCLASLLTTLQTQRARC